jgi:signal recognition particle receptor subunit beta
MKDIKIVFTGTVGSGKTEAIRTLSDTPIISTEALASDNVKNLKETTTVAMDFGEMKLDDNSTLQLYGTPGQRRFSYMWEILATNALGFIILIDNRRKSPFDDLHIYLDNFAKHIDLTSVAFGVTHINDNPNREMEKFHNYFSKNNLRHPICHTDARNKDDLVILLSSLLTGLEIK